MGASPSLAMQKRQRTEGEASLALLVPIPTVARIIGAKGANINSIQQTSGSHVQISSIDEVFTTTDPAERRVDIINASTAGNSVAQTLILEAVHSNLPLGPLPCACSYPAINVRTSSARRV